MITRRRLLIGGLVAGVGAVGAGVAVIEDVLPGGPALRRRLGMTGEDGAVPDVPPVPIAEHTMRSAARGRDVNVVTAAPTGVDPATLPVCLVLYGRGGNAHVAVDTTLAKFLTAALGAGVPPFALVAVDGGTDSYWIAQDKGDDPQAMLHDELPRWLTSLGLTRSGGVPAAALGTSMGCFGALVYARRRAAAPPVTALLSPALFREWGDASTVNAFHTEALWADNEPLRHLDQLDPTLALGVWCGQEDPFYPSARQLADRARPEVASFDHGDHNAGYWNRVTPDALRFVGERVRRA
ncbi:alpha/beta hydrolase [Solihabitans fulvus]|uniref:alpha/beta hydrolase n=1 Tax=Solihabitans fulvus TaxID=1892852 RepID=UPI0016621C18|nr:alpha/beta hydrolase-fold protein [Solihabitans fulvus]